MRIAFLVFSMSFFFQAAVDASSDLCDQARWDRYQLPIHGLNLANLRTTRTPEGGPYKRKFFIKCVPSAGCIIGDDATSKTVFAPGHPDADRNGYVSYPNIDATHELVAFEAIFSELVTMARLKKCGMELIPTDGALLITYSNSSDKSDFLVHSVDGSIIWRRTSSDGTSENVLLNEHLKK